MIYDLTVAQFRKMLGNFQLILDKAERHAQAKKFDFGVLLNFRLAPDQLHFTKQVQIMCDTAKLCVARLSGKQAPVQQDTETTLEQVRARIDSVLAYLDTYSPQDFADAASRQVSQPRWEGRHLTGYEYLIQHALPNFYFHFTTAYSILRHNGVEIGKSDYLGPLPLKN